MSYELSSDDSVSFLIGLQWRSILGDTVLGTFRDLFVSGIDSIAYIGMPYA